MAGIAIVLANAKAIPNSNREQPKANRVRVVLSRDDGMISLLVQDDGVGFDVAAHLGEVSRAGVGLIGMRERMKDGDAHRIIKFSIFRFPPGRRGTPIEL